MNPNRPLKLWHVVAGFIGAVVSHLFVKVHSWQDLVIRSLLGAAITWGLDRAT